MKINGKWYFNEHPVYNDNWTLDVSFVSNGKNFDSIESTDEKGLRYLLDLYVQTVYYWDMFAWDDDAYRTIDFGAAYQEVSDEFYTWLTANAVQLSKPIPMTHPTGILLLTAGKKCMEDIEVVPTFAAAETVKIDFNQLEDTDIFACVVENGEIKTKRISTDGTYNVVKNSILVALAQLGVVYTTDTEETPDYSCYSEEDDFHLQAFEVKASGDIYTYVN